MCDELYIRLQQLLDTFMLPAPPAPALLEILRIRFTPEEAEIALLLGSGRHTAAAVAVSAGQSPAVFEAKLEQVAIKGLVFKETKTKDGMTQVLYSLLPTAVGLWETSFAKGERNPETEKLAHYWREYYDSGWGKMMHSSSTSFCRVIPVAKAIPSGQEVYSYERACDLIKEQDYACVLHCACRTAAALDGKGCGKPTEVCMHFGKMARFLVEKRYARHITIEEALAILDLTEKAGLVHEVGNSKKMGIAMCSCCKCCCTQLRATKELAKLDALAPSRFIAEVNEELCVVCGTCGERCQVEAVGPKGESGEEPSKVNVIRCIGCGLCVTECPANAISMGVRESYREPTDTGRELVKAFIEGRKSVVGGAPPTGERGSAR
jgi:electron transport complex protein RnfB